MRWIGQDLRCGEARRLVSGRLGQWL